MENVFKCMTSFHRACVCTAQMPTESAQSKFNLKIVCHEIEISLAQCDHLQSNLDFIGLDITFKVYCVLIQCV